jgi:hypothetical protein
MRIPLNDLPAPRRGLPVFGLTSMLILRKLSGIVVLMLAVFYFERFILVRPFVEILESSTPLSK